MKSWQGPVVPQTEKIVITLTVQVHPEPSMPFSVVRSYETDDVY